MQTVLFTLLETIRCIGIVLQPVMPASANEILNQLAIDPSARSFSALSEQHCLQPGTKLQQPNPIFPFDGIKLAKIEKGIRLIDSHCHLDFKDFENDLPHVLARAGAAGVFSINHFNVVKRIT